MNVSTWTADVRTAALLIITYTVIQRLQCAVLRMVGDILRIVCFVIFVDANRLYITVPCQKHSICTSLHTAKYKFSVTLYLPSLSYWVELVEFSGVKWTESILYINKGPKNDLLLPANVEYASIRCLYIHVYSNKPTGLRVQTTY